MPVFTLPLLGLAAAVAVPALAGIYWLRNRFKRHPVSSLMLWMDHKSPREGGARMQRLQTPLLFFLEMLAIALLVLAATGPRMLADQASSPLVVVLDDSYSMRATAGGRGDSALERGREAVLDAIEAEGSGAQVRLIRAGDKPQVVGSTIRKPAQAAAALEDWTAQSPRAAIRESVTLASELGGPRTRILVVTDHPPTRDLGQGATQWWSFGSGGSNLALVTAVRAAGPVGHRCLIEVANLGASPRTTSLTVTADRVEKPVRNTTITVEPNQPHRSVFTVPAETPALYVTIGDDALDLDNRATLMPPDDQPIRVQLAIRDASLRRSVREALRATDRVKLASATGQLLVTDSAQAVLAGPRTWPVYLRSAPRDRAKAYVGPFVLNQGHPLCEGLSMGGVIWAAGPRDGNDAAATGEPVIMAGNTPLVTDVSRSGGRHDIRIHLNADMSTLTRSVNWPVLWWNLVRWRADEAPGLQRANIRLGTQTSLIVDAAEQVEVTDPTGRTRMVAVTDRRVMLQGDRVGVWTIQAGENTHRLAVNALHHDESDLSEATSDRWGRWVDDPAIREAYANVSWVVLLVALGVLATHLWLVFRLSRGGQTA